MGKILNLDDAWLAVKIFNMVLREVMNGGIEFAE
jgi:hypothetical protein